MTNSVEQLESFFDEFFKQLPTANALQISDLMFRAEMTFRQAGYRDEIPAGVKNILVVRLDGIGDMILTSGFLRELRRNFPCARITLVVSPIMFPIVEMCPYVNEVLVFDKNSMDRRFFATVKSIADFCRENFWHKKFSFAFLPQWGDNFAALLIAWLSGARERIGYGASTVNLWLNNMYPDDEARDNFLLTKNVISPLSVITDVEKHFYVLEAAGLRVEETHMELFFDTEDFRRARELLQVVPPNCKKIAFGIGGSASNKKYPVEKYLVALKILAQKNLVFIIVGGRDEIDNANYLEKNLPRDKVLNLVGKTTLRETEAVISQADFYVGNDTSTVHMAAAAQIPVLALYQEAQDKENFLPGLLSNFRQFQPWQTSFVALRPDHQLDECAKLPPTCGWGHADGPHCITQITPQEIVDGFEVLENL